MARLLEPARMIIVDTSDENTEREAKEKGTKKINSGPLVMEDMGILNSNGAESGHRVLNNGIDESASNYIN